MSRTPLHVSLACAIVASLSPGHTMHAGTKCSSTRSPMVSKSDVVATAVSAKSFTTLVAALRAAGLVGTLQGPGPFTVFAPTDEAFAKLPPGALVSLLKDRKKLAAVLTYHVVPGKVTAAEVVKLTKTKSVQGEFLKVDATEGVRINDAKVIKTDIDCTNGVIHVIDSVLLPSE